MASTLSALKSYLADSLKIFPLPVTTIGQASQRNVSMGGGLFILAILVLLIGVVTFALIFEPTRDTNALYILSVALESVRTFGFALISLLIMYALAVVLEGKASLRQMFSAHLCLTGAVLGGYLIALFAKLVIGVLFLGARDGIAGGLMRLGADMGAVAIGLIVMAYGILVMRFGGAMSWPKAIIGGLLHIALMVAIYVAYGMVTRQNELSAIGQIIQN